MKKIKFIYNPNSGDKKIIYKLDDIISKFQDNGYIVVPYRISKNNTMENGLEDINDNYEYILVAGGDGSIDRLVNYMKKNNINLPIAILPTGTANDFANVLNIPLDINLAIDKIINSKPKSIDLGIINKDYFVNIASTGMFTDVSQRVDENLKNSIGRVSYIIKGIEDALHLRKFSVSVKSKELEYEGDMYLILILNGRTAGNISLAHYAMLDDGLLDVIIFKAMPIPKTIPLILDIIKGAPIDKYNEIIYFKTDELYINCEEDIVTDIDGERGPNFPLHIKCDKQGIQILGIE
ncbi:Diacylglycerol kinase [uncultured Clostridium sp.]|uniref:YegS/Rv2252/BmrU family lipid kinase n=1 Tax=Paeniclostridium hominis TaxID=2764329 RepID=A0ABR7K1F6_9FIRM|nr:MULTISPECIES: YegS/Rv2252/BmrU family lipid kinase [Paeniclostridium]MDU1538505.1 YegS/Rv2252/BmrU family lipid kinase [Paeniclostridium sordellii]SCI92001.1 Diacylglycerol kinase [uncultured Clostridium sp.]MBC6002765.1 YegS/Rv2252/BmrU family lipid kinase [Paeniclostridium hominis]MBC8630395.1 YegS/Rv2252/BmrU family lipid kinase [[Eubacterium] tenue]SCJ04214.1 Diacylglycerol kinase [uncultured Clostridium sp.]